MADEKKLCPHCGKEYTEQIGPSYRHLDLKTLRVSWCHSKSMERRLKAQRS